MDKMGVSRFSHRLVAASLYLMLALGAALAPSGCQSHYQHQTRAVRKAREFVNDGMRGMGELERDHVLYNTPVFMEADILSRGRRDGDLVQTCLVWDIPEREQSLLVFGSGERNLRDWRPYQIVWREFEAVDRNRVAAIAAARNHVMNRMLHLSTTTRNRIRFSHPTVATTNLAVDDDDPEATKKLNEPVQTSLVWDDDEQGQKVVVIGIGERDLGNWRPIAGTQIHASQIGVDW